MQGGHRLISFQVETQVLNGADAAADAIAGFAHVLFAAVDGRAAPAASSAPARRAGTGPRRSTAAKGLGAAAARAKAPAPAPSNAKAATPRTVKPTPRLSAPKGT
jgi:hypothetical protein